MKVTPKVAINSLVTTLFVFLVGCFVNTDNNDTVTVYVSADEHIARDVFALFTKKTGIDVAWVGDTEASKTTALVQRLIRERERPIADVFWSSEILGTIQLARAHVLSPCTTSITRKWPTQYRDSDMKWFSFSPRARVIAFDPNVVKEDDLPRLWWEYGEAAMADPRFGTTRTHIAVMAKYPEQSRALFKSMKSRPLLGGNAATVQSVIDGTARYAMTDTDDVHSAQERGESLAMFMPRHHDGLGGGTLLIPNTVGVVQGCEHPELAEQFVDFLLSDEVATLLALSTSHNIPLQPKVAKKFPNLAVDDPLVVDFYEAASESDSQLAVVMSELSQ
jgi:iron(III) transport system substrate-binding protein